MAGDGPGQLLEKRGAIVGDISLRMCPTSRIGHTLQQDFLVVRSRYSKADCARSLGSSRTLRLGLVAQLPEHGGKVLRRQRLEAPPHLFETALRDEPFELAYQTHFSADQHRHDTSSTVSSCPTGIVLAYVCVPPLEL